MAEANWQQQATAYARERNLIHSPTVITIDLMSELGEVAKEILLATDYGQQPARFDVERISGELGDALYSLCLLATAVDVDLDQALEGTLAKLETRLQRGGTVGSTKEA